MTNAHDEQAIRDLQAAWSNATRDEDLDAILKMIADDAIFYVPGQPPMRGKKDFKAVFDSFRGKFTIEAKAEFDEIAIHGDWAHAVSRLAVNMKPVGGGAPVFRAGHTLTIFRKIDGRWVIYRDANLLAPEAGG